MEKKRILVVDDDPVIIELLVSALAEAGVEIYTANNGREGLQKFYAQRPDLVISDVMMPDMEGWEICRIIRQLSDVPIIMLTIQADDTQIIRGLDSGADDYITKPFNAKVVLARVRAALRRAYQSTPVNNKSATYSDSYLTIDIEHNLVTVCGEPIKLTSLEYRLLAYLLQHPNRVLTTQQILENVWGWEYQDEASHVRIYMWHLRQKLEADPKKPKYLLTEYGLGYRFNTVG
ncbi:MAG: DNA-binding response regulator [Anaerolineae bacterium]|nr:response regulator transcription factor [Anaerolineales bacterium]MCQ3974483.1 DNA-binding response regulator [Anaerolineae bacterium]